MVAFLRESHSQKFIENQEPKQQTTKNIHQQMFYGLILIFCSNLFIYFVLDANDVFRFHFIWIWTWTYSAFFFAVLNLSYVFFFGFFFLRILNCIRMLHIIIVWLYGTGHTIQKIDCQQPMTYNLIKQFSIKCNNYLLYCWTSVCEFCEMCVVWWWRSVLSIVFLCLSFFPSTVVPFACIHICICFDLALLSALTE